MKNITCLNVKTLVMGIKSYLILVPLIYLVNVFGYALSDDPIVSLPAGLVKGRTVSFRGIHVDQFLGIPFAEPPLGDLRFAKPVPKKPWEGVLQANDWGPICSQKDQNSTEDCLYLNVFVTSLATNETKNGNGKLRPVMVWIHGGGFLKLSANLPDYDDGTILTALYDVIIVTTNYRLGPLGFLYLPDHGIPGNMGLWDQRLALEWVKDNIIKFGGDPGKVTVFGESAGGLSISTHLVSSYSKGLFRNAVLQSGAYYNSKRLMDPKVPQEFLEKIKCNRTDQIQSCLSSYQYGQHVAADSLAFAPIVDHDFLMDVPMNLIENRSVDPSINILLGTVGNEGAAKLSSAIDPVLFDPVNPGNLTLSLARKVLSTQSDPYSLDYLMNLYFSNADPNNSTELRLILSKVVGDILITCPTYVYGRDLILNGQASVYAYHLTQKPISSILHYPPPDKIWLPATHADDNPFIFGYPLSTNEYHDKEEVIISYIMMESWTNFAKNE